MTASDRYWLWIAVALVALGCLSVMFPVVLLPLVGLLAYLLLAVPLAICVGRVVRGGAR